MTDNYLFQLKNLLNSSIDELDEIHALFCLNPAADFTRNRKITFKDYIHFMIQMQSKTVSNEILDFFQHSLDAPTKSAFTQQRYKFTADGWHYLFHLFVSESRMLSDHLWNGYRLLACDGSNLNIARNSSDDRTFIHEGKALNTMVDRYTDSVPAILMADRGYESFNVFAHLIRKGMKSVIRMKDINSNGILSSYDLPESEFDTCIQTTFTRRHTKETLGNPDTIHHSSARYGFRFSG